MAMSEENHGIEGDIYEEIITDEPMTAGELADIRAHRKNPNYTPPAPFNPLHENWTDTQVIILSPFFDFEQRNSRPPTQEEIEAIMERHPALEARPGHSYYKAGLEALALLCFRHNESDWIALGLQLSQRENFKAALQYYQNIRDKNAA